MTCCWQASRHPSARSAEGRRRRPAALGAGGAVRKRTRHRPHVPIPPQSVETSIPLRASASARVCPGRHVTVCPEGRTSKRMVVASPSPDGVAGRASRSGIVDLLPEAIFLSLAGGDGIVRSCGEATACAGPPAARRASPFPDADRPRPPHRRPRGRALRSTPRPVPRQMRPVRRVASRCGRRTGRRA